MKCSRAITIIPALARFLAAAITILSISSGLHAEGLKTYKHGLLCSDLSISVTSECVIPNPKFDSLIDCVSQRLEIRKPDGANIVRTSKAGSKYDASFATIELPILSLSCAMARDRKSYVIIYSGNLGNCGDCERFDIYDSSGKQLTGENGRNSDSVMKRKGLLPIFSNTWKTVDLTP